MEQDNLIYFFFHVKKALHAGTVVLVFLLRRGWLIPLLLIRNLLVPVWLLPLSTVTDIMPVFSTTMTADVRRILSRSLISVVVLLSPLLLSLSSITCLLLLGLLLRVLLLLLLWELALLLLLWGLLVHLLRLLCVHLELATSACTVAGTVAAAAPIAVVDCVSGICFSDSGSGHRCCCCYCTEEGAV